MNAPGMDGKTPTQRSQRWRERREFWRHDRPGVFRPTSEHRCEAIGDRIARDFVEAHHYSGSFPAARLSVGLYEGLSLVGVAVFSVPMREAVLRRWTGFGMAQACELGRFVLLDRVEANAETWFLARARAILAREKAGMLAVVAFSDPMPRAAVDGRLVMPGHIGGIYRASSAVYAGRTRARRLWLDRDGRVMSERALAKLSGDESGAAGVYRRLIEAGAPPIAAGEDSREYVQRALTQGPFRRIAHPGNHGFLMACGGPAARKATRRRWRVLHPKVNANAGPLQIVPAAPAAIGAELPFSLVFSATSSGLCNVTTIA